MDKLQYDSFYKFLVSAGVVLVAAPLFGLYYLLCNGNQILISQVDFEALSETSSQFVLQRDRALLYVLKVLPYVLIVLIVIGLFCIIYGGIKWRNIQIELDEQTKLKTEEQRANVKKLTATEIAVKAIKETTDEQDAQNSEISPTDRVSKALYIENLCFLYIKKKYSRKYYVQQNIKFGKYDCDILATSRNDNIDYLFEIKYWTQVPSIATLNRVMKRTKDMGIAYETTIHRNFRSILMVVTIDELKGTIISECKKYFDAEAFFDLIVISENELK